MYTQVGIVVLAAIVCERVIGAMRILSFLAGVVFTLFTLVLVVVVYFKNEKQP